MMCPCGGLTREHEYTTADGIRHEVKTCNACGRQLRRDWKHGRQIVPTPDHPDWKLTDESWQQVGCCPNRTNATMKIKRRFSVSASVAPDCWHDRE